MKKQFLRLTATIFATLFLSACGGGESDSSSSTSTTNDATSATTPTTPTSASLQSGSLSIVDAGGVEGLKVSCGTKELVTKAAGSLECSDSPIKIYLGDFKMGEIKSVPIDNAIYTQDILGVSRGAIAHPEVTKISMMLQSFDEDATPLNGITLAGDTLSLLSAHLSYDTKLTDLSFEDVNYIIEDVISTRLSQDETSKLLAVDYNTAQSNLTTKTAAAPALSYTQRASGRSL